MESKEHINLVDIIILNFKKMIPETNHIMIQVDSSGSNSNIRVLGKYIPDVFYRDNEKMLIGEAKTLDDFSRKHSKEQFDAYMEECNNFDGDASLIVAIPWQLRITAKNYFSGIKKKRNYEFNIYIINEFGKEMII